MIYITAPDNLWAIDARTGKELWHHQHTKNNAFHIGHRGAAIYKDTVYLTTPDCHLIALNAKNGEVKWDVLIADSSKGYWSTNAPLIIRNHVIVGVAGDFDNLPGTAAVLRCRHRQAAVDVSTARRLPAQANRTAAAPPADRCGTRAPTIRT